MVAVGADDGEGDEKKDDLDEVEQRQIILEAVREEPVRHGQAVAVVSASPNYEDEDEDGDGNDDGNRPDEGERAMVKGRVSHCECHGSNIKVRTLRIHLCLQRG